MSKPATLEARLATAAAAIALALAGAAPAAAWTPRLEPPVAGTALDLGAPGRDPVFGEGLGRFDRLCVGR